MKLQLQLLSAVLLVVLSGCTQYEWTGVSYGESFMLDRSQPHYERLDIDLIEVTEEGNARVRWNRTGEVTEVAVDMTTSDPLKPNGFVRLLAARHDRQFAVFETMWGESW